MTSHLTYEVFFKDAVIPVEGLIGEEGEGFSYILSSMNAERTLAGGLIIGAGNWLMKKAVEYANERIVFGGPIAKIRASSFRLPMPMLNLLI